MGQSAAQPLRRRLRRPRGLAATLSLLLALSCTSAMNFDRPPLRPGAYIELHASELAAEQRESLEHLFYRQNPLPPSPKAAELRRVERDLAAAPPVELEELRGLFGDDLELIAYATRDSDGDGVLDYRVSEYRGKFFEGDIDLDGDGIRNVYDAAPYDPNVGGVDTDGDGVPDEAGSFADRDGDGIPDHLDWSRRKPDPLPELQAELFADFDVILVERSARFTPELAQAAADTLRYVFREPLPTLRTIAVEDQLLISPDAGDNGFMLGQTQTLTVCAGPLEGASPLVLFGLFIHEVDHAWQMAQDFDAEDLASENRKLHFPHGTFTSSLERYGWRVDPHSSGEPYVHVLYWPHFYATAPRYEYRGSTPAEWAQWFEEIEREQGEDFLRASSVVSRGMIGPYAMTSPWEWHADHLMAAVYNRIDLRLVERGVGPMAGPSAVLRARMLQSVQDQWARFDYRNAAGTAVDRELGEAFALSEEELDVLIDRYVLPLADIPMLSEALVLEAEAIGEGSMAEWAAFVEGAEWIGHSPELLAALMRVKQNMWRAEVLAAEEAAAALPSADAGELSVDGGEGEPGAALADTAGVPADAPADADLEAGRGDAARELLPGADAGPSSRDQDEDGDEDGEPDAAEALAGERQAARRDAATVVFGVLAGHFGRGPAESAATKPGAAARGASEAPTSAP
ncbi:thrombospondin type 3 repeat-containing protein [Pseudenhygromyxa sp. WMMC2535]|uniref:thrombospondin type 3 repeat-containing protein n=1 Tax=Pseudenhygromyxa sp. WMMC2535 TaxID=2712867 RepID=UPI00159625B8|nr:thrombospondin type 3 repeat-containing protein [Pseudenhygromyxa sp. WMMC2535]NVB39520.1 thrombospondin type 3 repeat-containing protein [Pseudenhygromyxa sp. WMMC2535]